MRDTFSVSSFTRFERVEWSILKGTHPDEHRLLQDYMRLMREFAEQTNTTNGKRKIYYRVANVLREALCDSYLPRHWRSQCLDMIYQPIIEIQRLAETEPHKLQLRMFCYELHKLANYFLI